MCYYKNKLNKVLRKGGVYMRDYLRKLRNEKGITQLEVANQLNISESGYSLIESGERQKDMSISMAEKLAAILDVPLTVILENERKE